MLIFVGQYDMLSVCYVVTAEPEFGIVKAKTSDTKSKRKILRIVKMGI